MRFALSILLFFCLGFAHVNNCEAGLVYAVASDAPGANPDANAGTLDVWTSTSDSGNAGNFNGGSNGWGLYSNSGFGNQSDATASLSGLQRSLNMVGDMISIDMDHGGISTGAQV